MGVLWFQTHTSGTCGAAKPGSVLQICTSTQHDAAKTQIALTVEFQQVLLGNLEGTWLDIEGEVQIL